MTVYPQPKSRYAWFTDKDVVQIVVSEDVFEGEIVARTNSGNIVAYNPLGTNGSEKPIGVVVYADAKKNSAANVAFRGTFGDNFLFVKVTQKATLEEEDDSVVLTYTPLKILSVKVAGVEITNYTFTPETKTVKLPQPVTEETEVIVVYEKKVDDSDFWKLQPAILVEKVTKIG